MVKVCYVIHGWDFNPKMNWYPWIKRELEGKGFKVVMSRNLTENHTFQGVVVS